MPLTQLIQGVKKTTELFNEIVLNAVRKHEEEIVKMNQEQLQTGRRSDGSKITPKYRPFTVQLKRIEGKPTDRVQIHDKGDVYDGMYLEYSFDFFLIDSDDEKTNKLKAKYKDLIFGLNDQNLDKLIKLIEPDIQLNYTRLICA